MDIDSLLSELDDSMGDLGDSKNDPELAAMLEELRRLDVRALELAELVAHDPAQRALVTDEASQLADRLDHIADLLKADHADLHNAWADRISESTLDLWFVEWDSDAVSLRLAELLRLEE